MPAGASQTGRESPSAAGGSAVTTRSADADEVSVEPGDAEAPATSAASDFVVRSACSAFFLSERALARCAFSVDRRCCARWPGEPEADDGVPVAAAVPPAPEAPEAPVVPPAVVPEVALGLEPLGDGWAVGFGFGFGDGVVDEAWAGGVLPGGDLVELPFQEKATEPPAGILSESTPAEA
jgi:hypothetical protein